MNWKDPAIAEQLRRLWEAGHSCSTIARMIGGGITRNSVIGAVSRAGLPRREYRDGGIVAQRLSASKSLGGKIARLNRGKGKPFVFHKQAPAPASPARTLIADGFPIPPPAETDIPRVSFNDLNEDGQKHCKWPCLKDVRDVPLDQPMFCGLEPVPGSSYCKSHLARSANLSKPLRPIVVHKRALQVA